MTATPTEVRDAVLADYEAGHTLASIMSEHGVSRCTIRRLATAAGLPPRSRSKATVRPVHRCGCGTVTTSLIGLCQWCQVTVTTYAPGDGLPPGEWVLDPRTRVKRWVPAEPTEVEPNEADYDDDEIRAARSAYVRGDRSAWARVGQRLYCRRTQARKTAA